MERVTHPFPPVVDAGCRTLILGSFPSVKSRENAFYYGHPQNRFWRVLAAVFGEAVPADIPQKRAMLLRHGVALYVPFGVPAAAWLDVAAVCLMAQPSQFLCHGLRFLTSDKYSHSTYPSPKCLIA